MDFDVIHLDLSKNCGKKCPIGLETLLTLCQKSLQEDTLLQCKKNKIMD
jgi:hypothetical protein